MKIINMNKIIAMSLILILCCNMYVAYKTSVGLHKSTFNKIEMSQDTKLMPKIENKWGLLAAGFVVGVANTDLGFMQCFEKTKNLVETITPKEKELKTNPESLLDQIMGYFKTFLHILDKVLVKAVEVVCKVFSFDKILEMLKNIGSDGRFFLEGKLEKRGFRDKLKKSLHLSEMKKKLSEKLHGAVDSIMENLAELKQKVMDFFYHPKVQYVVEFVKCVQGFAAVGSNIANVIKGLITKITWIVGAGASTMGAGLAPVLAKLAYGLFCNYGIFKKAFDHIKAAMVQTDPRIKYYYSGIAGGLILNGFATAKRKLKK